MHVHKRYRVANLFRLKLIKMIDLLTKDMLFRPVRYHLYTVEWNICGLPHAHIPIWLMEKAHFRQIDNIISAELPGSIAMNYVV